jgi:hypothetical protein
MKSRVLIVAGIVLVPALTSVSCIQSQYQYRSRSTTKTRAAACDLNGDGRCDHRDFGLLRKALGACQADAARYHKAADADLNGCVTIEDVRQIARSGWDADSNGVIDLDDVGRLAEDQAKSASASRIGKKFDLDGDGWITLKDIRHLESVCSHEHCASH